MPYYPDPKRGRREEEEDGREGESKFRSRFQQRTNWNRDNNDRNNDRTGYQTRRRNDDTDSTASRDDKIRSINQLAEATRQLKEMQAKIIELEKQKISEQAAKTDEIARKYLPNPNPDQSGYYRNTELPPVSGRGPPTEPETDDEISSRLTKIDISGGVPQLQFLTPEAQFVENRKEQVEKDGIALKTMENLFKAIDQNTDKSQRKEANPILQAAEEFLKSSKMNWGINNAMLQQTLKAKEEYKVTLQMPDFKRRKPDGWYRPDFVMDTRCWRDMPNFDRNKFPEQDFQSVWSKICAYGERYYLSEEEFFHILDTKLDGDAHLDFRALQKDGAGLRKILDVFAIKYCKTMTLEDYNQQIDNFKRIGNEDLKLTMQRAKDLFTKTKPLYRASAFEDQMDDRIKIILKQVIPSGARAEVLKMEQNAREQGGIYTAETLIEIAHKYERAHKCVPTKDIQVLFQAGSGDLLINPIDYQKLEQQVKSLKQEVFQKKEPETKTEEIQINNAGFNNRGRPSFKSKEHIRRSSSSKRRRDEEDEEMTDASQGRRDPEEPPYKKKQKYTKEEWRKFNEERKKQRQKNNRADNEWKERQSRTDRRGSSLDRSRGRTPGRSYRSRDTSASGYTTDGSDYKYGSDWKNDKDYEKRRYSERLKQKREEKDGKDRSGHKGRNVVQIVEGDLWRCSHADCMSYHQIGKICPIEKLNMLKN